MTRCLALYDSGRSGVVLLSIGVAGFLCSVPLLVSCAFTAFVDRSSIGGVRGYCSFQPVYKILLRWSGKISTTKGSDIKVQVYAPRF